MTILCIPMSTISRERDFGPPNLIKSIGRCSLRLDTCDVLMHIALVRPALKMLDWEEVYNAWKDVQDRKVLKNMYMTR